MAWFKKKRQGVIDLTMLHKRGIIKAVEETNDYKELNQALTLAQQKAQQQVQQSEGSGLGFLSSLAGAAETSKSEPITPDKNKIDDIEFKMDSISKRFNSIMDRIDLLEKKLERLERRGG